MDSKAGTPTLVITNLVILHILSPHSHPPHQSHFFHRSHDIFTLNDEQGRPAPPKGLVRVHPLEYAGKTVENKLDDIRQAMTKVCGSSPLC